MGLHTVARGTRLQRLSPCTKATYWWAGRPPRVRNVALGTLGYTFASLVWRACGGGALELVICPEASILVLRFAVGARRGSDSV
jgi:hypothetical protein